MNLSDLFRSIGEIYEEYKFYFNRGIPFCDLIIISNDNYYIVVTGNTRIKIEKEYNLINMWCDKSIDGITSYRIRVEVGSRIWTSEKSMIELTSKIITPVLRQYKLDKLI